MTSTVTGARDVLTSTVAGAKDAVSSRVTGVMDMTKGAVQGSVELTKSAVSSGVTTVMGSTVGQMVASGVGSMLEKSEELVDHYLPMTDEELGKGLMAVCGVGGGRVSVGRAQVGQHWLYVEVSGGVGAQLMDSFPPAKLATAVEGFEPEQQKKQQSYFVRLGSLSAKLQHRALQHSLGKLQSARSSSHDVLGQLQRALDLVGPSPPPPLGWGQPPTPCFSPCCRWSISSKAWTRSCREGRRSCSSCGWSGAPSSPAVARSWCHQQ